MRKAIVLNPFIQRTMTFKSNQPIYPPTRYFYTFYGGIFFLYTILFVQTCKSPQTVDLAARELDVKINIVDTQGPIPYSKAFASIQFLSNGRVVQLGGNSSVMCNNVRLSSAQLFYSDWIPTATAGGTYTFRHTRNQVATEVIVPVQPRPVITSPAEGASISRSTNIGISYTPGGGTGVRGSVSNRNASIGGSLQGDNGSYTGLDASSLPAGPGKLSLTREFKLTLPAGGFKSVEVTYSSGTDVKVNWN